jgi:hypothetical protein
MKLFKILEQSLSHMLDNVKPHSYRWLKTTNTTLFQTTIGGGQARLPVWALISYLCSFRLLTLCNLLWSFQHTFWGGNYLVNICIIFLPFFKEIKVVNDFHFLVNEPVKLINEA